MYRVLGDVTITDTSGDNKMRVWTAYDSALSLSSTDVDHVSRNIDYGNGNIEEIDIYAVESDVTVTEAIDITEGFIEAKSIVWNDTIGADYINFHSTETLNVDHGLEALNILESVSMHWLGHKPSLRLRLPRGMLPKRLWMSQKPAVTKPPWLQHNWITMTLEAYNDALSGYSWHKRAEAAAYDESVAEDALADVTLINTDFDSLIDDIQSTGDSSRSCWWISLL